MRVSHTYDTHYTRIGKCVKYPEQVGTRNTCVPGVPGVPTRNGFGLRFPTCDKCNLARFRQGNSVCCFDLCFTVSEVSNDKKTAKRPAVPAGRER